MTDTGRQDRAAKVLQVVSAVLAGLTLLAALAALPVLIDTSGGIRAQRRSDAITACRSEFRADLDIAQASVDDLIIDGLTAFASGDDAAMTAVIDRSGEVRARRDRAVDAYGTASTLSSTDPDAMIAMCDGRAPHP